MPRVCGCVDRTSGEIDQQQTDAILQALKGFNQQWSKYKDATLTVRRRLTSTQTAFEELVGVRTRVLDRQIERVELLRTQAGLELDTPSETDDALLELEAGRDDHPVPRET